MISTHCHWWHSSCWHIIPYLITYGVNNGRTNLVCCRHVTLANGMIYQPVYEPGSRAYLWRQLQINPVVWELQKIEFVELCLEFPSEIWRRVLNPYTGSGFLIAPAP
jgi:hypothetical protein